MISARSRPEVPTLYAVVSLSAVSMFLLDTAAHWSRVDLQPASHLLFICSATSALETEPASKTRDAIATKRIHPRRQNLLLIATGPLTLDSFPGRAAASTFGCAQALRSPCGRAFDRSRRATSSRPEAFDHPTHPAGVPGPACEKRKSWRSGSASNRARLMQSHGVTRVRGIAAHHGLA